MNITLFGTAVTRSLRATWALEEAGAEFDFRSIALREGAGRQSPFIELNPGGKVPVLIVEDDGDEQVIPESAAIVTWVGEHFAESGLVPAVDDPVRSQYFRWLAFTIGELEQPLWTISKHSFAIPAKYRVPDVIDTAKWEYGVALKVLEQGLGENQWILGERFSAADILIVHTLMWGERVVGELGIPALASYLDRARARPAFNVARDREKSATA